MEQKDKDIIRSNYTCLIANLSDNFENVLNFLFEKKIITAAMKERVQYQSTPSRRSSSLLDLIVNRGARAFRALYEACVYSGLKNAADILRPDKAPHSISPATGLVVAFTEQEKSLPDHWPTKEHFEQVKYKKLIVNKVDNKLNAAMVEIYQTHLNKRRIYPMYHKLRGNALIILNETFPMTRLPRREGSEWDREGLIQLFNGLGFRVNVKDNLTKELIDKAIKEETSADHSDHDCFVAFIMSYGRKGVILDTKGTPVSMKGIIDQFNEVDDLKNKPKLIFFQACQGEYDDPGHKGVGTVGLEDDEDIPLSRHDGQTGDGEEELAIPQYDDFFVFRSSPDDTRSYRHRLWGSWFTQAVIYIFSEFAYKCELYDLQLKVNDLLSKAETQRGKYKNVAEFVFIPGTKFYFFPGLYET